MKAGADKFLALTASELADALTDADRGAFYRLIDVVEATALVVDGAAESGDGGGGQVWSVSAFSGSPAQG